MSETHDTWWILGFEASDVRDWQDARIADAIETAWTEAGAPALLQAWWSACDDHYAFRWYVCEAIARMLDDAAVSWRNFIVGRCPAVSSDARPYLPLCGSKSSDYDERRDALVRAAS